MSSVFLRLTGLQLRLASSSASAAAFACASACVVWLVTSFINIASISSMLRSTTSGLGLSTICTLPDESDTGDLGDTGDVGTYAVSGFISKRGHVVVTVLLLVLVHQRTQCPSSRRITFAPAESC